MSAATRRMDGSIFEIKYLATAGIAGFFAVFLVLEFLSPLRERKRQWVPRVLVNLVMSAGAFVAGSYVVRPVALWLAAWTSQKPFGLLNAFPLPPIVGFTAGFLLLDLTFYYWHRANHEIGLLWRFHNVHHIDPDLDVTTSFRFHFVEVLYSAGFRALQVAMIGVAPATYIAYEFFFQAATLFHHSNMRLPIGAERALNKIFVTPRMHGIHHSDFQSETDSNYSVIFRWWDALHHSLRLNVNQSIINIGVAGYQEPEDNGLWRLLVSPFLKQKEYWMTPDGRPSTKRRDDDSGSRKILAE